MHRPRATHSLAGQDQALIIEPLDSFTLRFQSGNIAGHRNTQLP
jgi:hypothetical protein